HCVSSQSHLNCAARCRNGAAGCFTGERQYNCCFMPPHAAARPSTSHVRWVVCALLFFATTINYVDRQVLSLLAKTLETTIGWNNIEYSNITSAFTAAYALGFLGWGRLLDRYGTRLGFTVAVSIWSLAAILHAAAATAFSFGVCRALLGL